MLNKEQLLYLIDNGVINISPLYKGNIDDDGGVKITLSSDAWIVTEPDADTFIDDPREIVINVFAEELPLTKVDLNTHKIIHNSNVILQSKERIFFNKDMRATIVPDIDTFISLEVYTHGVLKPGYNDHVKLKVRNPWEYAIYLQPDKLIAKVYFDYVNMDTWFSGVSGISGIIQPGGGMGASGASGMSGSKGSDGLSGISGYSGVSGGRGQDGVIGHDGASGYSGVSGFSGSSIGGNGGMTVNFYRNGTVRTNRYLENNGIPSSRVGKLMRKSGKIKYVVINSDGTLGFTVQIKSAGGTLTSLAVSPGSETAISGELNVAFSAGEVLSCMVSAGTAYKPDVLVDIAWD